MALFAGPVQISTFGREQYHWQPAETRFMAHDEHAAERPVVVNTKGFADPDGPIKHAEKTQHEKHLRSTRCVRDGDPRKVRCELRRAMVRAQSSEQCGEMTGFEVRNIARMRDMPRRLMRLLTYLLVLFAVAIFVHADDANSSKWTVQKTGDRYEFARSQRRILREFRRDGTAVSASGSNGVIPIEGPPGETWTRLHVQGGEELDFRSIQARYATTAYVMSSGDAGNSRIYKTTDGGANWKLQYTDKRKEFFLDALVCSSKIECFAVGVPIDGKFVILRNHGRRDLEQLVDRPDVRGAAR